MKNISLDNLLKKLQSDNLSFEEYLSLKEQLQNVDDEILGERLSYMWSDYKEPYTIDPSIDEEIKLYLDSQMSSRLGIQRTKPNLVYRWWFKIAMTLMIPMLFIAGFLGYQALHDPIQYLIVKVAKGEKSQVILPDGTYAWLNADSELSYPTNFSQKNRLVKLKGEGYFEVSKSMGNNFRVEVGDIEVEVLGTQFNISAYSDEEYINITLKEGKVAINSSSTHDEIVSLVPSQMLSYAKDNSTWEVKECDPLLESLWVSNVLRFENTPIIEVYKKLEKWFGVSISIENMNSDKNYGFTIKKESLNETLQLINHLSPINYTINGEEVIIRYK